MCLMKITRSAPYFWLWRLKSWMYLYNIWSAGHYKHLSILLLALLTKTLIFENLFGVLDTTLSVIFSRYPDYLNQYSDRHEIIEIFTNVVLNIITPHDETTATCLKQWLWIRVITKLPNSEQSYKEKVKTHNYINRQNQSTTGKLWKLQWLWLGTGISKEMVGWIRF